MVPPWAKHWRIWYLSDVARPCRVSFVDAEGIRHSTELQAASLYEAVTLSVRAFREHDCSPGPASRIEVEVRGPSVTHAVTMSKVQHWLEGPAKSPGEKAEKERLKRLLAS